MSSNSPAMAPATYRPVRSPPDSASATSSIGWRTSSPAAWRCRAHPGLADATIASTGAADGRDLAGPDVAAQARLEHRVGPAGAAAQPLVVQLDEVDVAGEHGPHRAVAALDVTEVARILHRHGSGQAPAGGEPVEVLGEQLVHVDGAGRDLPGGWCVEQVARSFSWAPQPAEFDHHRGPGGGSSTDPFDEVAGLARRDGAQAGVGGERAAAATRGEGHAEARRLEHPLGGEVHRRAGWRPSRTR